MERAHAQTIAALMTPKPAPDLAQALHVSEHCRVVPSHRFRAGAPSAVESEKQGMALGAALNSRRIA